jgi:hypothetical protein
MRTFKSNVDHKLAICADHKLAICTDHKLAICADHKLAICAGHKLAICTDHELAICALNILQNFRVFILLRIPVKYTYTTLFTIPLYIMYFVFTYSFIHLTFRHRASYI